MEIEKSREILRILRVFNPWWEAGKIENVEPFKRLDFYAIKKRLDDTEIVTLVGARQVGKTTMMEQLVEHLLAVEDPKKIFFIRADNAGLNAVSKSPIEDSLQVYQEYVLKEEISSIKYKIFVLIDEVQKVENWTQSVKSWYDINKKIKFIISGSSSAKIIMDSTKPFVGRAINQILVPFKFVETARYDKFVAGKDHQYINSIKNTLKGSLVEVLKKKDISETDIANLFSRFQEAYKQLALEEPYFKGLLTSYIIKGGYPRAVKESEFKKCVESLTTNYRDVINSDIKQTYSIRKPQLMEAILVYLARNTSSMLNMQTIARDLEETPAIIKEYIGFLRDTFIISVSENFRHGKSKLVKKKVKKFYLNDVGLRNVINNSFVESVMQDGGELGKLVETIVFNHCLRLKFNLTSKAMPDMFYWRENGDEIDIILDCMEHVLPVEVKYRNRIDRPDVKAIREFVESGQAPFGFVITVDKLEKDGNILYIPLWLFLLMV